MKERTILHLYSDTLDLYGDYFNVRCLTNRIEQMGGRCRVLTAELDEEPPIEQADLVYIGHGKARNLAAVAAHFYSYRERTLAAIEAGKLFFLTGNSRLLLGASFEGPDGAQLPGIGLFPTTGRETNAVFTADIFARCAFDESIETYGFVNRTQHIVGENPCPLFLLEQGPGDDGAPGAYEGNHYKNLFATWQMGPLLARNPRLLRHLLTLLLGSEMSDYDDTLEQKALALTLREKQGAKKE